MESTNFEGIWIPKEILLDKQLSLQEKTFLALISSLDNDKGCYASNAYFAEMFSISKTRVSLVIKSLIDKKYIISTIIYKEGTKEILNRVLNISYRGYIRKVKEGMQGKLKPPTQGKLKEIIKINNKDDNKEDKVSYQLIADMYNDTCVSFPKLTKLSEARKKAIKARLNTYSNDEFNKLFEMAERSDFLKGKNNRNWMASFDWLIKDSNMAKVLDGNYTNMKGDNNEYTKGINGENGTNGEVYLSEFTREAIEYAKARGGVVEEINCDF